MSVAYVLAFEAERVLNLEEQQHLSKKLTRALQVSPFGAWKPGVPDHPTVTNISLHREVDPLLGYDKRWLVQCLMDHLMVQEKRITRLGINSTILTDVQFSLLRIDEFAGETVPKLENLRAIALKGVY